MFDLFYKTFLIVLPAMNTDAFKTCSNSVCLPENYNKMDADR